MIGQKRASKSFSMQIHIRLRKLPKLVFQNVYKASNRPKYLRAKPSRPLNLPPPWKILHIEQAAIELNELAHGVTDGEAWMGNYGHYKGGGGGGV